MVDLFGGSGSTLIACERQVDNFTRIHQRHAAILNRHVDHVRFLENFLHQHHWSGELEEQLIAELTWLEERLEQLSVALGPEVQGRSGTSRAEDRAATRAMEQATPSPVTRTLALIVRLLLDDWPAQRELASMLPLSDLAIRSEAALALGGWRVQRGPGISYGYHELIGALRDCPLRAPAAVRLALLQVPGYEVSPEITNSADPELQFMTALAQGDRDASPPHCATPAS